MIFNYTGKTKEPTLAGLKFNFRNASDDVAVIDIDGTIGRDYFEEWLTGEKSENTGPQIKKKIRDITASKIVVNINSLGGDVNDGLYIHDLLAEHSAEIETVMRGFNASAATIIGQAGDTRMLSDNGLYLVHLPMVGFCGMINRYDVDLIKDDLASVESRIINLYKKRAKKSKDFTDLMEQAQGRGVWLEPGEALDYGLIDEIYEPTESTEEKDLSGEEKNAMNMMGMPMPGTNGSEKHHPSPAAVVGEITVNGTDIIAAFQRGIQTEKLQQQEEAFAAEAHSLKIETEMFIKSNEVT